MVKHLGKYFGFMLFFILALIAFSPKSSFYFYAEKELQKYDVIVSNEKLNEKFFTLVVHDLEVSLKGIESAKIEEVDIRLLFLYNTIDAHNIELSSVVESFMPRDVESLHISYSIINPLVVTAKAEGAFGKADIQFNILDRELSVLLHPSKRMLQGYRRSLRMFKKDKNGEYRYAKIF